MSDRPPDIVVRIEELSLHGVAPGTATRTAAALESSLAGLLSGADPTRLRERGGRIDSITSRPDDTTPTRDPEALGARTAQTIWRGLTDD